MEYQPKYSDAFYQQWSNYLIKIQANTDSRVSPGALRWRHSHSRPLGESDDGGGPGDSGWHDGGLFEAGRLSAAPGRVYVGLAPGSTELLTPEQVDHHVRRRVEAHLEFKR